MTSLEILTGIKNWVDNRIPYSPYIPPASLIFEEDGIYQVKDGSVYPIGHPDISTQASTLYQRFGNLDIQEIAIVPGRENEIPDNALIIYARSFNPTTCVPATCKHGTIYNPDKAYAEFMLPIGLSALVGQMITFLPASTFDKTKVAFMTYSPSEGTMRILIEERNGVNYLVYGNSTFNKVHIHNSLITFDDPVDSVAGCIVQDVLYDNVSVFKTGWLITNPEDIVPSFTLIQYIGSKYNPYDDEGSSDYDGYYGDGVNPFSPDIDDVDDGTLVDLGLPSGNLWAKSNIGASKPSESGLYFAFGEATGYADDSVRTFNSESYECTKYNSTDGKIVLDLEDDGAYVSSSGYVQTPTASDLKELLDHTNWAKITLTNGVPGIKFVNKTDPTKYIFVPNSDCYMNASHDPDQSTIMLRSCNIGLDLSDEIDYTHCYMFTSAASGTTVNPTAVRYPGVAIRGVQHPDSEYYEYGGQYPLDPTINDVDDGTYVDLGLPSGTLWAKSNLDAAKPSDYGKYYQWGQVAAPDQSDWSSSTYSWTYCPYTSVDSDQIVTFSKYNVSDQYKTLTWEDDAICRIIQNGAHIATKAEFEELFAYTDHTFVSLINGKTGIKFVNKTDPTKYIFIPTAGVAIGGSVYADGESVCLWTSSLDDVGGSDDPYNTSRRYAYAAMGSNNNIEVIPDQRYCGFQLRPVKPSA